MTSSNSNTATALGIDAYCAFAAPGLGRAVLAVDDDRIQLALVKIHLLNAGFLVETASGADEALAKARSMTFDAIMSDVVMEDVDGFTLCEQLRRIPNVTRIPIILMSADFRESADKALAKAVGANALVTRSSNFQEGIETLVRVLAEDNKTSHRPSSSVSGGMASVTNLHWSRLTHQLIELQKRSSKAEARYQTLIENATDAISVLSPEGVILEVNRRWEDLLLIPREQMVGRHIRELAPPGAETQHAETYDEAVKDRSKVLEIMLPRADGTLVEVEITSTTVDIDEEQTVLCIARDITERVEAARRLAASERKYRLLIEKSPDIVWSSDLDGKFTFISANVESLYGVTPDEILSREPSARFDRIHPDDCARVRDAFESLGAGRIQTLDIDHRWLARDNKTWRWVHCRALRTRDDENGDCIQGVYSDITERKLLEEQLIQSQKLEAVGQLTAGVAHDFNNVLAIILSNAEFLARSLDAHDERRRDAEDIAAAALKATTLTKQLLAFSRRQPTECRPLDLGVTITGIERMVARLIGKHIDVSFAAQPNLGLVRADAGQIEQVILNLAVNARDAMPNGGKLVIETTNVEVEEPWATSEGRARDAYVLLTISDTGCGMDEATRTRIFDPFFTTKAKGTGLGLSTSYGIIRGLGGHVEVVSAPKLGTVFKIYLPRIDGAVVATAKVNAASATNQRKTIFVVDDDDGVRVILRRILHRKGYDVLVARDAEEALSLATRHMGSIDLVMSDINLPVSNGVDLSMQLGVLYPGAKLIFISGKEPPSEVRQLVRNREDVRFVEKPFVTKELLDTITELLEQPVEAENQTT